MQTNKERLLQEAIKWVGKDASPFDYANDELGCAESVCSIIKHSIARDFPLELATWRLHKILRRDKRFKQTTALSPGNIILSPSFSGNGTVRGHVGIIGENGIIYSSDSRTGLWNTHQTIYKWVKRYRGIGGMPIYVFEPVGDFKELADLQEQINFIQLLLIKLQALVSRITTNKV